MVSVGAEKARMNCYTKENTRWLRHTGELGNIGVYRSVQSRMDSRKQM